MREQLHWLWVWYIKEQTRRRVDRLIQWIAWKLPKPLVTWCYVRVGAHATSGEYSSTVVPEIGMMEALERWTR